MEGNKVLSKTDRPQIQKLRMCFPSQGIELSGAGMKGGGGVIWKARANMKHEGLGRASGDRNGKEDMEIEKANSVGLISN